MYLCDGKALFSAAILDYCENSYIFLKKYFKGMTFFSMCFFLLTAEMAVLLNEMLKIAALAASAFSTLEFFARLLIENGQQETCSSSSS